MNITTIKTIIIIITMMIKTSGFALAWSGWVHSPDHNNDDHDDDHHDDHHEHDRNQDFWLCSGAAYGGGWWKTHQTRIEASLTLNSNTSRCLLISRKSEMHHNHNHCHCYHYHDHDDQNTVGVTAREATCKPPWRAMMTSKAVRSSSSSPSSSSSSHDNQPEKAGDGESMKGMPQWQRPSTSPRHLILITIIIIMKRVYFL